MKRNVLITIICLGINLISIGAHHKTLWGSFKKKIAANNSSGVDELKKINIIQVEPTRFPTIFENTTNNSVVFTLNSLQTNTQQKITVRPNSSMRFPVDEHTDQIIAQVDDGIFIHRISARFYPHQTYTVILEHDFTRKKEPYSLEILEHNE